LQGFKLIRSNAQEVTATDQSFEPFFFPSPIRFHPFSEIPARDHDPATSRSQCKPQRPGFNPHMKLPGELNRSMLPPLNCSAWPKSLPVGILAAGAAGAAGGQTGPEKIEGNALLFWDT
jgi:hypothetical protein